MFLVFLQCLFYMEKEMRQFLQTEVEKIMAASKC